MIAIAPAVLGCLCSLFRFVSSFVSVHCWSGVQLALADVRWRVREWNFSSVSVLDCSYIASGILGALHRVVEFVHRTWFPFAVALDWVHRELGFFVTSDGGFSCIAREIARWRLWGAPRPCLGSLVRLIHRVRAWFVRCRRQGTTSWPLVSVHC